MLSTTDEELPFVAPGPPEEEFNVFVLMPMKFPKNIKFTLFNWKKLMIVTWGIQLMFFISVAGLIKSEWGVVY